MIGSGFSASAGQKTAGQIEKETKEFTAEIAENAEKKNLNNLCVLAISAMRYFLERHRILCFTRTPARASSLIKKNLVAWYRLILDCGSGF